ncbi:hypothetical protein SLA2020_134110 [Shorea laevis]
MTHLFFLNLSNNGFHSSIPAEFKNLLWLSDLDLHSNKFSGHLDTIFSQKASILGHFNSIDVSNNIFSDPIEANIGERPAMDSITSLILSNNPLGGSIPKSLGNLSQLQVLEMENDGLSGPIPVELGNAIELTTILLAGNKLSGAIPGNVLNLTRLKVFNGSDNKPCGMSPPHKANIPASSFQNNTCLCGAPLTPCENAQYLFL